jgi:nucleoside-diphosphate-sugar epimerase
LEQIEWICADITDVPSLEIAFQNINMVYHCAALISFDQRRRTFWKTNIEGTANIVNFCLAFGIQKLCFVSSIATLGDLPPHEKIHHWGNGMESRTSIMIMLFLNMERMEVTTRKV